MKSPNRIVLMYEGSGNCNCRCVLCYNRLSGGDVFERVIEAVLSIVKRGGAVSTFFVGMTLSIATPILPCLDDMASYGRVRPSFCSAGDPERSLPAADPMGNLKVFSDSPIKLGSLLDEPFERLLEHEYLDGFIETVPPFCGDYPVAVVCRGGCRSSAQLCYGSLDAEDPYLLLWREKARKPAVSCFGGGKPPKQEGC